jgi:hypothetical protein
MDVTFSFFSHVLRSHAGGAGQEKTHCQIILQYMCDDSSPGIRDGRVTATIPEDDPTNPLYGQHETYEYYQKCKTRQRNKGLFTADQNMNGRETARHTRQNNNGNRYGFECPEERDYYPYWHWSPWRDIAVMTSDMSLCPMYREESQNVKAKGECSDPEHNNPKSCTDSGAEWIEIEPWDMDEPECIPAPWRLLY